jgi:membrane-anchored protein YejM (alkaline phosphatase superfamily)
MDQADFVFLHLPVPHSPNIWSRARGDFAQQCGSSYVDSLALADRELGSIVATLKSSPRWKDTTLIVEGDHSWRTYLWKDGIEWTQEDAEASRAGFDPRPAVIVHLAGQTQAKADAQPWSLLNVHTVLGQVIRGEAVHF